MTTGCRHLRPAGMATGLAGVAGALLASLTAHGQVPRGFTDPVLVPGETIVRSVHITELRDAADARRARCGLAAAAWTDPELNQGVTPIRAIHISELRTAVSEAHRACGRTPPAWTDPQLVPGVTPIKALHLMELRSGAVSDIQNLPPQVRRTLRAEILRVGAAAEDVNASEHFSDPNGDALTYTAASSDIDIVTARVSNETIALRPVGAGKATVTVTAIDPGGLSATQGMDVTVALLHVDFDETALGEYTAAAFHADWPTAEWVIGLGTGRAEVIEGAGAYAGRSLRLKYPAGTYGSRNQAIQSEIDLPRSYDELYVSYRVRFDEAFDFVKGGKLPGLIGGAGNTGGNRPDGTDGWSGRMMWRRGGEAVQYLYHPDQPDIYGEDFRWNRRFEPGRWHTVEHHFVMNTPGANDGVLQAWFDGEQVLNVNNLRFRDVDSFAIEQFYISTFFGGGDSTWAPAKDEHIAFDDIVVTTTRIDQ